MNKEGYLFSSFLVTTACSLCGHPDASGVPACVPSVPTAHTAPRRRGRPADAVGMETEDRSPPRPVDTPHRTRCDGGGDAVVIGDDDGGVLVLCVLYLCFVLIFMFARSFKTMECMYTNKENSVYN